jgi:hypothetical protein
MGGMNMRMPRFTAEASVYAAAITGNPVKVPKSEVENDNWFSPRLLGSCYFCCTEFEISHAVKVALVTFR